MRVGMTGTREGMTVHQKCAFEKILCKLKASWIHHGDCLGADTDAHDIAESISLKICIHPPEKGDLRAFNVGDDIMETKGYLARNRDIVKDSQTLIGFPKEKLLSGKKGKGGTWYAINYAIKQGGPVYVVYPDGIVERFN